MVGQKSSEDKRETKDKGKTSTRVKTEKKREEEKKARPTTGRASAKKRPGGADTPKAGAPAASPGTGTSVDYHGDTDLPLKQWVAKATKGGATLINKEFLELRKEMASLRNTTDAFKSNLLKNRYADVPCWDQSRVVIRSPRRKGDDYIHANFIHGLRKPYQFIATQGPMEEVVGTLDNTQEDFWRMIWEQKVVTIVMLCATVEGGKLKCSQYWPEKVGDKMDYGPAHIECKKVSTLTALGDLAVRTTTLEVVYDGFSNARQITHFLNDNWPDRKCPPSAYPLVEFVIHSHDANKKGAEANGHTPDECPVTVHCSAGIGRSGTFIVVHLAISLITQDGSLDVKNVVRRLRTQRAFAVQSPVQYACVYQALLEFASRNHKVTYDAAKFAKDIARIK